MQQSMLRNSMSFLEQLRRRRGLRNALTLLLVFMGPVLVVTTLVFFDQSRDGNSEPLRAVVLMDLVYVLLVAALVMRQVARVIAARRRRSAGSKLHLRLTTVFTFMALVPTILVAVFAAVTLNFGLEGWFSERVRNVVNNSLTAAQAYEREHRDSIEADANLLANYLNAQRRRSPTMTIGDLREYLNRGQLQLTRAVSEAYVIDSTGELLARGERSYLFDFEKPSDSELDRAMAGQVVIIEDWPNSEFRALISLTAYADRILYVTRDVDGEILALLDDTKATVALYNQLETARGTLLFEFALIYLGFALIVILAALWFGIWFAERLSRPVGRLASAVERVGEGDFDVRVREETTDDEIAVLGKAFNRMTQQVKTQRDALISVNEETERRRRLFDSVLSGVTAGVIGLGPDGDVQFVNSAAQRLLNISTDKILGHLLVDTVPEFSDLFTKAQDRGSAETQAEIELIRAGVHENLLVRVASRQGEDGETEGYVIAFDDVTDLVSAQRMAAWGDVARRIAHEIKNPLTPIRLSAERMRRKLGPLVNDEERNSLEQYTDVIIRQTNDLRRIVDEFAKFARMPAAQKTSADLLKVIESVVLLQREAGDGVEIEFQTELGAIPMVIDESLMSQALTNLVKNAREAIAERQKSDPINGKIKVNVEDTGTQIVIRIQDNGIGLPEKRSRLFEPYVTHRDEGTGLGLPIVKKIIEDHDGYLDLRDAPAFDGDSHVGAEIYISLPKTVETENG